jgi:hypothetical protein
MKGTLLEPTINHLLTSGLFSAVQWAVFPNNAIAKSSSGFVFFNSSYQSSGSSI